MEDLITVFKKQKLKLTPQRLAIFKYLRSVTCHPTAETIYSEIHKEFPTMSLATVYKTLKTLTNAKLIQEINVGEGNFRYDGNANIHPHIQCMECGKVADFDELNLDNLNKIAQEHTDFKVLYNKVYYYGICKECSNS